MSKKLFLVINVDWFFLSHRLPVALGALEAGYEVHIATQVTDRLAEMEDYGFIVHPLSFRRTDTGLTSIVKLTYEIFSICRLIQPEVTHFVTVKPVLFGGIAARLAKVPSVVAAISGLGFLFSNTSFRARLMHSIVSRLYQFSLGHPNLKVIVQNNDDLTTVQRLARLPDKAFRLLPGSGVDLRSYQPQPEPSGVPVVLMASRMLTDKGVLEFINAARSLRDEDLVARFVLVGDPDPANPASLTQAQLEGWQQEGTIEWWGHHTNMPVVFAQSNLVVLPSYYGEGLPKVLIEAAACGRAIVTTHMPGCRDAIEPDVTGILVPPRDAETLAEAIKTLILNQDLRREMASAGRKRAVNLFPVEKIVDAHLQIYQELIDKTTCQQSFSQKVQNVK